MYVAATPSLADRIVFTLDGLARAVAARIAARAMTAAMIVLVWGRVKRAERDILRLLALFGAGRLRVLAGPRAGAGAAVVRAGARAGAARLPVRFAWLLPLVPGEAACFAGQLRAALGEAEMVALLEASPQARRVLRPLCRMLGIERSVLGDVSRGDVSRGDVVAAGAAPVLGEASAVARVRVPRVRVPVDLGRVPLPRGVLAAARRDGFGRR